jgi:hypothetical protein
LASAHLALKAAAACGAHRSRAAQQLLMHCWRGCSAHCVSHSRFGAQPSSLPALRPQCSVAFALAGVMEATMARTLRTASNDSMRPSPQQIFFWCAHEAAAPGALCCARLSLCHASCIAKHFLVPLIAKTARPLWRPLHTQ